MMSTRILERGVLSIQMVVSFHPLFEADCNILCAGREPGPGDLAAIRSADGKDKGRISTINY